MTAPLRFSAGATLLGASPERAGLREALALAPHLICADGGANALPADLTPEAVIGDLDSLEGAEGWRARLGARLIHVAEQESTDLEKCLRLVDAPFLIGVGFLGGRLDHELAALSALIADPRPALLIGAEDAAVSGGAGLDLDLAAGERISLFPLRPVTVTRASGLRWPASGLAMEAGGRIGTSNEATGNEATGNAATGNATTGRVSLRFDRAGMAVILPRRAMEAALAALRARDDREICDDHA